MSPSAKPRRPGVLLDTDERLLPFSLPEGRIERLKFCLPQRPAELRSCRTRLRPRCECAQRGASRLTCAAAAAPRRGPARRRRLLGGAWGSAGLCPAGHSAERVAWEPGAARESIERESRILPTNCSSAELSPI